MSLPDLFLEYDAEQHTLIATEKPDGASAIIGSNVPRYIGAEIVRRYNTLDNGGDRVQRAMAYLAAVDDLNAAESRRLSGLPGLRTAMTNVLASRASPPEYPGLALVPQSDLDALEREWRGRLQGDTEGGTE